MPRICNALENRQAKHQNSMVKIEGMINNQSISILIDQGAILSYNHLEELNYANWYLKSLTNRV